MSELRPLCASALAGVLAVLIAGATAAAEPTTRQEPDASWAQGAIFYHLYVRSYADSDGDGHGDLVGLAGKLDHIAALGVDGMLLLPVFQNDHDVYGGYATTDFYQVEKDYGGDAAWEAFIAEARKRNLKVMLDLSITHVADTHPWFQAVRKDPAAPERQHFIWAGPPCPSAKNVFGGPAWNPLGEGPCYYSPYGGTVPGLNLRNAATAEAILDVAEHWLSRGVIGYRLDSAKHLIQVDPSRPEQTNLSSQETHEFCRRLMGRMKAANPQSFAVAEVFDPDVSKVVPFYSDGIDMAFDYPVYLQGLLPALQKGSKKGLANVMRASLAARPAGAMNGLFLNNHDVPGSFIPPHGRVADMLGGDTQRLKLAAMLLLSLPGTPFIYYGDEIGLRTSAGGRTSRNPMQWDSSTGRGFTSGRPWLGFSTSGENVADQRDVPDSPLETYRRLIAARRSSPALTRGDYREIDTAMDSVLAFVRQDKDSGSRVLVAVNLGAAPAKVTIDTVAAGISGAQLNDLLTGHPLAPESKAAEISIDLAPHAGRWIDVK